MGDRHRGAERAGRGIDLGIELLGKRLDDAGAEAGFALGEDAVRLADPVVGDRQLPVRAGHVIGDDDLALGLRLGEGMLQGIHHELGHDQAETLGLAG